MRGPPMKRNAAYMVLAVIIIFHLVSNIRIISQHKTPPTSDSSDYIRASLEMHDLLRGGDIKGAIRVHDRYGPLFSYLAQPFYYLFGRSISSARLVSTSSFILLITSVFFLGKELFSEKTGLLAAFLISFYPQVYGMSRVYIQDLALTSLICLDLYLLIKTKDFTARKISILLGIALGISALIKPAFVVWVFGPVLVTLFYGFHLSLNDKNTKKQIKNFLLTLFISLALYSLWFIPNYGSVLQDTKRTVPLTSVASPYAWSLYNLLWYPKLILNYQILYLFGVLSVLAFICFLIKNQFTFKTKLFLSSFLILPYWFFTLIDNNDVRYILPLTIGISLVSSAFLASINLKRPRRVAIILSIAIALFQFSVLSYGNRWFHDNGDRFPLAREYFHVFFGVNPAIDPIAEWHMGIFQPSTNSLAQEDVVRILIEDINDEDRGYSVLASSWELFSPLGNLLLLKHIHNIEVILPQPLPEDYHPDYFLLVKNQYGEGDWIMAREIVTLFENDRDAYALLSSIQVCPWAKACSPEGGCTDHYNTTIEIYKRVK